ncbi:hypothetical protein GLYMA_14G205801v4 [Glycine max]|nr:hypothetical protein GLYMA_14G205801v4 [Glycine max]KAH1095500.1 hypothetical protein GYH30_040678 [Glycine max]
MFINLPWLWRFVGARFLTTFAHSVPTVNHMKFSLLDFNGSGDLFEIEP